MQFAIFFSGQFGPVFEHLMQQLAVVPREFPDELHAALEANLGRAGEDLITDGNVAIDSVQE